MPESRGKKVLCQKKKVRDPDSLKRGSMESIHRKNAFQENRKSSRGLAKVWGRSGGGRRGFETKNKRRQKKWGGEPRIIVGGRHKFRGQRMNFSAWGSPGKKCPFWNFGGGMGRKCRHLGEHWAQKGIERQKNGCQKKLGGA